MGALDGVLLAGCDWDESIYASWSEGKRRRRRRRRRGEGEREGGKGRGSGEWLSVPLPRVRSGFATSALYLNAPSRKEGGRMVLHAYTFATSTATTLILMPCRYCCYCDCQEEEGGD